MTPRHHQRGATGSERLAAEIAGSRILYARNEETLSMAQGFKGAPQTGNNPRGAQGSRSGSRQTVLFWGDVFKPSDETSAQRSQEPLRSLESTEDHAQSDPVAYVTSENASRRHLSTSQLAHAVAAMAGWERERAKQRQVAGLKQGDSPSVQTCTNGSEHGRTSEKLAAKTGVSANAWPTRWRRPTLGS